MNRKFLSVSFLSLVVASGAFAATGQSIREGVVPKVAHISGMDKMPQVLSQSMPKYPSELRERGIQGVATVEMLIDSTGRVVEAKVVRSTVPEFGVQALAAAKQWSFVPAEADGKRISARIQVPFEFVMPQVAALEQN